MGFPKVMVVCALWPVMVWGQAPDPYRAARAAMQASIERQRESVQRQREAVRPAGSLVLAGAPVEPDCEPVPPGQIEPMIDDVSQRQGLTPDLLRAIIQKESAFRPCAVSPKGAQGLMQLMPATALQFGILDPFDPQQNLDGGARFLKQLLERYGGDLSLALGAFNAGPGRVDAAGGLPPFPETLNYVSTIQEKVKAGSTPK
jgi:soluble lytic murein transglycosylase-like protein